jgi:hypothetical protein
MKRALGVAAVVLASSFAVSLQAQQVQQVECRDMSTTGNFLAPNESVINGKACRPAGTPLQAVDSTNSASAARVPANTTVPVVSAQVATPSTPTQVLVPPAATSEASPMPVSGPIASSDGKTRVFVTDSQSWETRGGSSGGGNKNGWGASSWIAGGARPQTAEIIKTLNQRCPEITVTNNLQRADFVLTLDHEGGKGLLAHRNKVAVFNSDGDDIFSASTRELGNSVKDSCQAMLRSKK